MASTDTQEKVASPPPPPPPEAIVTTEKSSTPPPPEVPVSKASSCTKFSGVADAALRALLFAASLSSVVVMVTGNQTKLVPFPLLPSQLIPVHSKFNYSPAFIYLVAALSVSGLYSIITGLVSLLALFKPSSCSSKAVFHFVIFDVLLLGIVAAATGTAGGVAYIGLKGNSHSRYVKVCNTFDSFCQHLAASIALSLVASIVLVLLSWLNVYSLSKRIPK